MSELADLLKRPDVRTSILLADMPDGLNVRLYRALLDMAGFRARQAALRRAERSEAIASGILRAAGALPLTRWTAGIVQQRIERKGPAFYGLRAVPHLTTIRAVLRKAAVSVSEPPHAPIQAVETAATTTTD